MYDLLSNIVGSGASSEILSAGSVVIVIVMIVATVDLISQFISVFTRIK